MVKRIYVEKKETFDAGAKGLLHDIRETLHIKTAQDVRIINRYDIEGVDDETYEMAKFTVFAEKTVDNIWDEEMPEDLQKQKFFAVEFLDGQYDQRADSAAVCIKLMKPEVDAMVKYAKVVAIYGNVSDEDFIKIKEYCINPVDSQIAKSEKPETLALETSIPKDVEIVDGFREMDEKA